MRIYNLFPRLAGPVTEWQPHLARAADMGFNWIFVNPIQTTGSSRSLYSIRDYFAIDPDLVSKSSKKTPDEQMRETVKSAEALGLGMMVDLVINHCAFDSPLLKSHPEWFVKENGRIANPYCVLDNGEKVVWGDLAKFDHQHTRDPEGLYKYCLEIVEYLGALGFRGFRCDAAYQLPAQFWRRLIEDVRKTHPDAVFAAETLGCTPDQTRQTASAGFDACFNSSKWWDFSSPWLMRQYQLLRQVAPSISFPESHDTPRLFAEAHGNVDLVKQRYLFAALFSAGVMMPMGYEFGFTKPLHVVNTTPSDWESPAFDLTDFIRAINRIKAEYQVFQEESLTQILPHENQAIMVMWKAASSKAGEALLILNKDPWNRQRFYTDNLYRYVQQSPPNLKDVSPEWTMDHVPTPFEFELAPGMGRILVTE